MHVAVDDHSRYASMSVNEDETAECVTKHLIKTCQDYASRGIKMKRILKDSDPGYRSKMFADACRILNVQHLFTNPYMPQTNEKAERILQTLLREWAHTRP